MDSDTKGCTAINKNVDLRAASRGGRGSEPVYCPLRGLKGPSNNKHSGSLSCAWLEKIWENDDPLEQQPVE